MEIDRAKIAVLDTGERILVYPGEGADAECFAGEMLDPPERMARLGMHVSCMWLRRHVVALENTLGETTDGR